MLARHFPVFSWVGYAQDSSVRMVLRDYRVPIEIDGVCATPGDLIFGDLGGVLGCNVVAVGKWRARFVETRMEGLVDERRPGCPPTITDDQVEEVVVATLESPPKNATYWSRTKRAERSGLSKSTIGRIWKSFEMKPHRQDGFKLATDPQFVGKVYDIVGLYLNPPEAAVVYSVDELCETSHNSSDVKSSVM